MFTHKFHPCDFFVSPDIRLAETLPSTAFHSRDILDRELALIFDKSWHLVDPSAALSVKAPSTAAPFSLPDTPLFLLRDKDGKLGCFSNTCTHAWYSLVQSPMPVVNEKIICRQHGRQFGCDGKFIRHPRFARPLDFLRPCDNLAQVPVKESGPFVFASLSGDAAPLDVRHMMMSITHLDMRTWRYVPEVVSHDIVGGNWKLHAWNYMDKFHIPFIHGGKGGLTDAIDLSSYQTELYRRSSLQWAFARDPDDGFLHNQLSRRFRDKEHPEKRVYALWWFIFPNMTFNFYPWGLSINIYMPVKGEPDKTKFIWHHFVADEALYLERESRWQNQTVVDEDIDAIAEIQKSIRSRFATRGRFAPDAERGPHWFHRLVYEELLDHVMK